MIEEEFAELILLEKDKNPERLRRLLGLRPIETVYLPGDWPRRRTPIQDVGLYPKESER